MLATVLLQAGVLTKPVSVDQEQDVIPMPEPKAGTVCQAFLNILHLGACSDWCDWL